MALNVIKSGLGGGGFGIVDLVQDSDTGAIYARKTFSVSQPLPPQLHENVKRRFIREARTQSGIQHPNIVAVLGSDLTAEPPYYLMAPADCSLQDAIDLDKSLGGGWMSAVSDIVAALDELHRMSIFHRDLKPQNVLKFGATATTSERYAVSDFGLVAMNESRLSVLTSTGMAKGTDYYTAPEITSNLRNASAQSDIYSLGCIIHEMVGTGARIPCSEIRETGPYGAILRNCTRTDPARRFKTVRSVLDALASIASPLPSISPTVNANFGNELATGQPLTGAAWKALVDFVEDNEGTADGEAVMRVLAYEQVLDLGLRDQGLLDRLGAVYARWAFSGNFNFDQCDRIANILETFIGHSSFETRVDALMALLRMGTSHNRWYIERMFCRLCSSNMDEALARRLSVEFRASGADTCVMIDHLEASIGATRLALHPVLSQTLHEICP